MKLKKKPKTSRAARRAPRNQRSKVRLEFDAEAVVDGHVVRRKGREDHKDVIAYYRRQLEGNPNEVFSLSAQEACILLADAVALYYEVGGFEVVLRYSEDFGWHCHSGLPT